MPFTFIHASDLHLDSPFRGVTAQAPAVAGPVQEATFSAFDRLIRLAIERQVLFVLLAGDVYDGADRSLRAQLRFLAGLGQLAARGIACLVVHGNHDSLDGWSSALSWPEGVHVFGSQPATVRLVQAGAAVAAVCGISYSQRRTTEPLAERLRPCDSELFQIALLHANCGGNPDHEAYAPCSLDGLLSAGFDYWALGHVHEHAVLHEYPHVVYAGNTQGRHSRECGPRGCYLVRVDDRRRLELEFHGLESVRWAMPRVSIDGLDTVDGLQRAVEDEVLRVRDAAGGRSCVCRVALEGRGPLYDELAREGALAGLCDAVRETVGAEPPFIWVEELLFGCRPQVDLARRQQQGDLLGTALQLAAEWLGSQDLAAQLAPVLAELFEHRRAGKALDDLPPGELRSLVDEARWLCVDLLEGRA
jgi:exonuclease SbcD